MPEPSRRRRPHEAERSGAGKDQPCTACPAAAAGRARQPRLGIVDVYDLDRQRQLILLRRDNVEHLLLIGGPNDVVVENNIVRVPGARLPATAADAPERIEPGPSMEKE